MQCQLTAGFETINAYQQLALKPSMPINSLQNHVPKQYYNLHIVQYIAII